MKKKICKKPVLRPLGARVSVENNEENRRKWIGLVPTCGGKVSDEGSIYLTLSTK